MVSALSTAAFHSRQGAFRTLRGETSLPHGRHEGVDRSMLVLAEKGGIGVLYLPTSRGRFDKERSERVKLRSHGGGGHAMVARRRSCSPEDLPPTRLHRMCTAIYYLQPH